MKFIYALTLSVAILFFAGCSKSGDGPSSSGAKATLTSGKWQITGGTVSLSYPGIPTQTTDVATILSSCILDNYIIFETDGTGTTDEGATKCDASAPQVKKNNGTWSLQENDTKLIISDPASGLTVTCNILQLTDAGMKLQFAITNQGATSNTTYIFAHIK